MLKKIYLEITNICNLNCTFCHKTKRNGHFMSKDDFTYLVNKIKGFTDYLYFHLMGEPLLHPDLEYFIKTANDLNYKITIATNGLLINEKQDILLKNPIYKITFSLHSFEANSISLPLENYINDIVSFCKKAEKLNTICVLRLWNENGENKLNDKIIKILQKHFTFAKNKKGFTLSDKIYLEYNKKFIWPDINADKQEVHFCMGLRDHIGILCDGTVVPCCLDADGEIPLGNVFQQQLNEILNSEKAQKIYNGFSQNKCTERLCSRCEYATRFN